MKLPSFKTRSVLVENLVIQNKRCDAVVLVSETRWWGFKQRKLRVAMRCNKITRKNPEWSSRVAWDNGYLILPVCSDSDVIEVANKTMRDMRNMNMRTFSQLLAHRLVIHSERVQRHLQAGTV